MIKRLHLVVEVAFACQTYICLPSASLKTLVHTALARLKQEDFVLEDRVVMEFSLQAADVKVTQIRFLYISYHNFSSTFILYPQLKSFTKTNLFI